MASTTLVDPRRMVAVILLLRLVRSFTVFGCSRALFRPLEICIVLFKFIHSARAVATASLATVRLTLGPDSSRRLWYRNCSLHTEKLKSKSFSINVVATTFGDPHLVTLDGFSYTFNGHGVYTMLNIDEIGLKFQARMQPLKTEGRESRGTF